MKSETSALIQKLTEEHSLSKDEYEKLELNPVFVKTNEVKIIKYNLYLI